MTVLYGLVAERLELLLPEHDIQVYILQMSICQEGDISVYSDISTRSFSYMSLNILYLRNSPFFKDVLLNEIQTEYPLNLLMTFSCDRLRGLMLAVIF